MKSQDVCAISTFFLGATIISATPVGAAEFTTTEAHLQYGRLNVPDFAGGGQAQTIILTPQHASGYAWGDIFLFADIAKGDGSSRSHFNDWDIYSESYVNLSTSKILDIHYGDGILRDVGVLQGVNFDLDSEVLKFLPGIRLSWNVPGFAFLNSDVAAYIDASGGVDDGRFNAPKETDSWMLDVNFATKSLNIGNQYFNLEGHVEYIGSRKNEFGDRVSWHVLGQPQLRWDAGNAIFGARDKLFFGIEYQFWFNKLGEAGNDEHAAQALAVWRF